MADGLNLKIEVTGEDELKKMLDGLGLDVKDLRGAMQEVGKGLKTFFSGNVFASRGGAIGESWQALSPAYAALKASGKKRRPNKGKGAYPGRPVLVRTGEMQRSFKYETTLSSIVISNPTPYFKYHQSSKEPRTRIPRRVMLKLTDQLRADALNIVANKLAEKIVARSR